MGWLRGVLTGRLVDLARNHMRENVYDHILKLFKISCKDCDSIQDALSEEKKLIGRAA